MKLLLVEPSGALRARFERLFTSIPGIELTGSSADAAYGAQIMALATPDVAVIDIGTQLTEVLELISCAARRYPEMLIIGVTSRDVHGAGQAALRAGAHLCVDADDDVGLLSHFLFDCANSGLRYLPPHSYRGDASTPQFLANRFAKLFAVTLPAGSTPPKSGSQKTPASSGLALTGVMS
jgi:DNA-binding NarL/FixJ family response regulator